MLKYFAFLAIVFYGGALYAAESINGLWTTIDDETNTPKSVVQIYDYQGKTYGRVVKLFKNPDKTAKNVAGSPRISGLDIIWELQDEGDRYRGGKILDPVKGKVYRCEAWKEDGNLILRGKIGPFGRNQTWLPNNESELAVANPVPRIPEME